MRGTLTLRGQKPSYQGCSISFTSSAGNGVDEGVSPVRRASSQACTEQTRTTGNESPAIIGVIARFSTHPRKAVRTRTKSPGRTPVARAVTEVFMATG